MTGCQPRLCAIWHGTKRRSASPPNDKARIAPGYIRVAGGHRGDDMMIDIKAFIDERPIAPFLCALLATCFLVVVADGMDVAIMGFVAPPILQEWHISRPAFGFVISAAPFGL